MVGGEELLVRQRHSQRAFFRALADGSEGARLIGREGVQATVVPVRQWYSIFNSVLYEEGDALLRELPALAADYAAAGCKALTVWVVPGDDLGPALQEHGHELDSTPMLMAAALEEIDLEARRELALHPAPTAALVAAVNDRAHGILPDWSMSAVFADALPGVRPYVVAEEGRAVAALLSQERAGDCYLWFVATDPEARRRGLASELVRHALRQAAGRGCATTTLESTRMAESTYARLGYRAFGRYEMWERRF